MRPGAVFGIMGAAVAAMRSRGINPFQTGLGSTIVLNLLITFAIPGISIGGHVGGLIGGFVGRVDPHRRSDPKQWPDPRARHRGGHRASALAVAGAPASLDRPDRAGERLRQQLVARAAPG